MLTLRLRVVLERSQYEEACRTLRSVLGPIRAQPGCSRTSLLRELDDDCSLTFLEEWRDLADLEAHLHSPAFRKVLAVLEEATVMPEVELDSVSNRSGLELVESILAQNRIRPNGNPVA